MCVVLLRKCAGMCSRVCTCVCVRKNKDGSEFILLMCAAMFFLKKIILNPLIFWCCLCHAREVEARDKLFQLSICVCVVCITSSA